MIEDTSDPFSSELDLFWNMAVATFPSVTRSLEMEAQAKANRRSE